MKRLFFIIFLPVIAVGAMWSQGQSEGMRIEFIEHTPNGILHQLILVYLIDIHDSRGDPGDERAFTG